MALSNLTVIPKDKAAALSWTISSAAGDTIVVEWRYTAPGVTPWVAGNVRLAPTATSFTITGLTDGVPYDVSVSQIQHYPALTASVTPVAPPPPPSILRVGVVGITNRDYINSGAIRKSCISANLIYDRIDVGDGTNLSAITKSISEGIKVLPLYNPGTGMSGGLNNRTAAQCATEVKSLATQLLTLGITELEFGNEPFYNSDTPQTYAAKYVAAHNAIAGMGITLIPMVTGDYAKADGTWSKTLNGNGWIGDFIAALPSPTIVDAWSCHPYPVGGSLTTTSNEITGWPTISVYRNLAVQKGSNAPWYITEAGIKVTDVGTQAAQATTLTNMLNSLPSYVKYFTWYASIDDSSGTWGLFNSDGSPRPSFTAMQSWVASHGQG